MKQVILASIAILTVSLTLFFAQPGSVNTQKLDQYMSYLEKFNKPVPEFQ